MNLGALIDKRQEQKRITRELQAAADASQKLVDEIETEIFAAMKAAGLEIAAGSTGKVSMRTDTVPQVTDWGKFHEYIRAHNAFYLLQRRVTATAYKEACEAGEVIPGVIPVQLQKLSFTAA